MGFKVRAISKLSPVTPLDEPSVPDTPSAVVSITAKTVSRNAVQEA